MQMVKNNFFRMLFYLKIEGKSKTISVPLKLEFNTKIKHINTRKKKIIDNHFSIMGD